MRVRLPALSCVCGAQVHSTLPVMQAAQPPDNDAWEQVAETASAFHQVRCGPALPRKPACQPPMQAEAPRCRTDVMCATEQCPVRVQAGRLRHLRSLRWPLLPRRALQFLEGACPHIAVEADPAAAAGWPPADQGCFDVIAELWDVELVQAAPAAAGAHVLSRLLRKHVDPVQVHAMPRKWLSQHPQPAPAKAAPPAASSHWWPCRARRGRRPAVQSRQRQHNATVLCGRALSRCLRRARCHQGCQGRAQQAAGLGQSPAGQGRCRAGHLPGRGRRQAALSCHTLQGVIVEVGDMGSAGGSPVREAPSVSVLPGLASTGMSTVQDIVLLAQSCCRASHLFCSCAARPPRTAKCCQVIQSTGSGQSAWD